MEIQTSSLSEEMFANLHQTSVSAKIERKKKY